MNRNDFLAQLRSALESDLSAKAVKEHVDYYDNYIREEVRGGKSEQEVLDMLGDPWAIAKTILMSAGMNERKHGKDTADVQKKSDSQRKHANMHVFGLDSKWKLVAAIVAVFAVLGIIMSIVFGIIRLIAPIAIPVLVVLLIIKIWNNK